jgi:hypothetical protein
MLIWSLSLLLSNCAWICPKDDPVIDIRYVDRDIPTMQRPKGLSLMPTYFEAVSYKNLDEYLAENKKRNNVVVFYAIDVIDYENLSFNVAEYMRYMQQSIALFEYYESKAKGEVDEVN